MFTTLMGATAAVLGGLSVCYLAVLLPDFAVSSASPYSNKLKLRGTLNYGFMTDDLSVVG